MPQKPTNWGSRPAKKKAAPQQALDRFVSGSKTARPVRLNIEVPEALRKRIKAQCALDGKGIKEVIVKLLEERFPE